MAAFDLTEQQMREGLAEQFMFSGLPPETIAAVIDALVADTAFVEATKVVADRITEIASRFATPATSKPPA